jgi:RNA polymerase sporulation-specific sigma factor
MTLVPEFQTACQTTAPYRDRVRQAPVERLRHGDDDPVAKVLAREQLRALIEGTRTLSPLERRALMLANNDRPHTEIAATLHIRVRAVNNALQRARHKLREPVAA